MSLFKKKNEINTNVCAPVNGRCIDLSDTDDEVFASKIMGDGFAIEPSEGNVCSPSEGIITMMFPTAHAFGILTSDKKELLIHIGIDTVKLNGKGFTPLKKVDDKVTIGEPIVVFDEKYLYYKTNVLKPIKKK
jgi:PTS system, glucose subfamily, IIA component